MPNQNNHRASNLWLGFLFGAATATTLAFFLGTKKGREMLKKLLDVSENLEENILILGEELEEMVMDKVTPSTSHQAKKDKPSLGNLLDKMKILKST